MDAREAREHLEMVDAILRRGESETGGWACRELGMTLVGFGLGAGLLNIAYQVGTNQNPDARIIIVGVLFLIASLVYMGTWMALGYRNAERISLASVRSGRVMG